MAKTKDGAVAEKNTEAKAEPKESRYHQITVRVFKGIEDFDVPAALTALAEASSLQAKLRTSKGGRVSFQVDTAESAKVSGRGRPRKLVDKETEKKAVALLRAAMKDPARAPQITALLAKSENGEDVSQQLGQLIGIES
jgi:hypothetical protein